jgi:hypothetical protein
MTRQRQCGIIHGRVQFGISKERNPGLRMSLRVLKHLSSVYEALSLTSSTGKSKSLKRWKSCHLQKASHTDRGQHMSSLMCGVKDSGSRVAVTGSWGGKRRRKEGKTGQWYKASVREHKKVLVFCYLVG